MQGDSVIIAGGGTAGHLFPGVAVARELRGRHPRLPIHFAIGGTPLERRILEPEGFPFVVIRSGGIRGRPALAKLRALARAAAGLIESFRALRTLRAGLVLGVGGYASAPVVLAGVLLGRPTLLHEQNYQPGWANRLLAPWVDAVAISFAETSRYLAGRGVWTGNPVRAEIRRAAPPREEGPLRLLVFGGSQGARRINSAVLAALPDLRALPDGLEVRHAAGELDFERVREGYRAAGVAARVVPFLADMADAYAWSDLVVARAGASACAEIAAAGRPAILVPLERAGGGHQEWNAEPIRVAGGAVVIRDGDLDGDTLAAAIRSLRSEPGRLRRMAAASAGLGRTDAAARLAAQAERLLRLV